MTKPRSFRWVDFLVLQLQWRLPVALLIGVLAVPLYAGEVDFSPGLLAYVADRWGRAAPGRLLNWQRYVKKIQANTANRPVERDLLDSVNAFWNRVPYVEDQVNWNELDYWATPVETQASNGGDCEDYVFGKYFTLRELGVPTGRLRITYVRVTNLSVPHMVLAYYSTIDDDPLIMDNLVDTILPGSQRSDLRPIYSFNHDDFWSGRLQTGVQPSEIRRWRDLLDKMEKERRM